MKRWARLGAATIVAASAVERSAALSASWMTRHPTKQTARSRLSPSLLEVHQTAVESEPSSSQQPDDHTAKTEEVFQVGLHEREAVPSKWSDALRRFFFGEIGPPLVVLSILGFAYARLNLSNVFTMADTLVFTCSVIFWWIQEYFFHRVLLHSPSQWLTPISNIHQKHHEKTYFHVSIDPPALLLGWLFTAHLILKSILPWSLCLSSTIGYASAGLFYEWSHYM